MKHINSFFKKIFFVILLFFYSQPLVNADDIKEFEIENMSVGVSLLKYFNKNQIKKFDRNDYTYPAKGKYYRLYIENMKFENFDYLSVDLKFNDNNFIIYGLNGMIDFEYNEGNKCLKKQNQVKNDIKDIFQSDPGENKIASNQDPTGKSIIHNVWFEMQNGKVLVQCYNFTKQTNIQPGLDLAIRLKEFADWLNS
tara:strand:+ start:1145 stop:1732 length:588 start_codon:yes stop_codon:yes gene_type:complete